MSGLYAKALMLQERNARAAAGVDLSPPGVPTAETAVSASRSRGAEGISSEERQKIASQIDSIMADNRMELSPQALAYTPKRRGVVLPLVSNVAILAALVVAGLVASRLLNHQERDIASGVAAVQGAENRLIAALKQDSERRLRERDQAILATQTKMRDLAAEQEKLKGQTDSLVRSRTDELERQFGQRLADERERLQAQGLGAKAEADRLRRYEEAQRQALEQDLAAVRRQAEADLATRQKAIAELSSQYQKDLETARQERLRIQSEAAAQRQAAQADAAPGQTSRVSEELSRMQADRQKEQLVLDQIYAGYDRVNRALQSSDYAGALSSLDAVRAYYNSPEVAALPTIQKRRPVELFLVASLDELIRGRRAAASASADAASLVQGSADLRAVSDLVAQGDSLSQAGNLEGARAAYLEAMRKIPYVGHGYARLEELRPPEAAVPAPGVVGAMRQANVFYLAGNFLGSVEQYRAAVSLIVKDEALAKQITDGVMNAGYHLLAAEDLAALTRLRTAEEKRRAVIARLKDVRTQYEAYTVLAPDASAAGPLSEASLASLLQAKILVRGILDSEPVRSRYPDLGATIEQYFTALERQGREEGRRDAFAQLAGMLARLKGSPDAGASARPAIASAGQTVDPVLALLDQLDDLLTAP